eukprot:XP_014780799.1 PREDICTED: protein KTI12 homolog [Octopus bimaculoides]
MTINSSRDAKRMLKTPTRNIFVTVYLKEKMDEEIIFRSVDSGQKILPSRNADVDQATTHQWLRGSGQKAETEGFIFLLIGFRYELYCVAKSSSTPHCVVYCAASLQQCSEWNKIRLEAEQYSEDILEQLARCFEMPNSQTRWDSPLFVIQKGDELPKQKITDALFSRKAPPPNMSTQSQPLSSTNFLYDLDCVTNNTIKTIMQSQSSSVPGDQLTIPGVEEKIVFNRHLPLSELQRYRRQFITYTKMHPVEDTKRLSTMFVSYLNSYIS